MTELELVSKLLLRKNLGPWLRTIPESSLGLRLEDEVVRVATGVHLGLSVCQHSGAQVKQLDLHALSCKKSQERHFRPAAVNDIKKRSLGAEKIPAQLEPFTLSRSDGKRPDGAIPSLLGEMEEF